MAEPCDGAMTYRQTRVTRAYAMEQLIDSGELEHMLARTHAPAGSAGN